MNVTCPYCNKQAEYVDSTEVYGQSYGMIYLCRACRAYVGVHRGTDRPRGTLAKAELREARKQAHAAFDPLWQSRRMTRTAAYAHLSRLTGIPKINCHIGEMNIEQCNRVVTLLTEEWPEDLRVREMPS